MIWFSVKYVPGQQLSLFEKYVSYHKKNTSKDSVESASVIMGMLGPLSHRHKESQVCKELSFITKQSLFIGASKWNLKSLIQFFP